MYIIQLNGYSFSILFNITSIKLANELFLKMTLDCVLCKQLLIAFEFHLEFGLYKAILVSDRIALKFSCQTLKFKLYI